MPSKEVKVKNDNGDVDVETVTLSVNAADEVTWTNNAPHKVNVDFKNNSPFASSHFGPIAANGGTAGSGPIINPTLAPYKYVVTGTGGSNDPRVIINH